MTETAVQAPSPSTPPSSSEIVSHETPVKVDPIIERMRSSMKTNKGSEKGTGNSKTPDIGDALDEPPLRKDGSSSDEKELQGKADKIKKQDVEVKEISPEVYKLKVDGQVIEKEYTKDQVTIMLQKAMAADKRFEEASSMRKQAETFASLLRDNPAYVLQQAGHNVDSLAEQHLLSKLEYEKMNPDQKRAYEAELRIQQLQYEQQAREREEFERQQSYLTQHYANEYQTQIIQALETSGLPKTPETVMRMARYMSNALDQGMDLGPEDFANELLNDYQKEHEAVYRNLTPTQLRKILGEDRMKQLRQDDLQQVKSQSRLVNHKSEESIPIERSKKLPYLTEKAWDQYMNKVKQSG